MSRKSDLAPRTAWIDDWRLGVVPSREAEIARELIRVFTAFWSSEDIAAKSLTTQRRYSGSLHALGGYLIGKAVDDEGFGKLAHELLAEALDDQEGPLVYHDHEVWQGELDTVCRKLYKFLIRS
jgi:hypothetical protein